ncbi:MAG TPA: hypothetical protein DEV64_06915 [Rhodospirillaceae bacterium]|nr:hypothetical protein [Rhodospirillaceae bacterium]
MWSTRENTTGEIYRSTKHRYLEAYNDNIIHSDVRTLFILGSRGLSRFKQDFRELDELIKTRCWLEETAIRESIAAGDDSWEEQLVLASHRLSKTPRSDDRQAYTINPEWESLHRAFHLALISACGSRRLVAYCEQLNDLADRYRQLAVRVAYPRRNELNEHQIIMNAAISRDSDTAVEALMDHYHRAAGIIRNSVDRISRISAKLSRFVLSDPLKIEIRIMLGWRLAGYMIGQDGSE